MHLATWRAEQQRNHDFIKAVIDNEIDTVKHLIENVDIGFNGNEAIRQAAYRGHRELVELLIENGASLNGVESSKFGWSGIPWYGTNDVIILALRNEQLVIAEDLLKHGAVLNDHNYNYNITVPTIKWLISHDIVPTKQQISIMFDNACYSHNN